MTRIRKKNGAAATPAGAAAAGAFRNRIVGYELVDPQTIIRNPLNWRTHPDEQRAAMRDLLEQLGFVDTCVVNRRNRHLIDGEMRLEIALANHEGTVPVLWVDLDADEEKLALATFNPLAELASTDPERLARVLAGVKRGGGGALAELLQGLEQAAAGAMMKPQKGKGSSRAIGTRRVHTLRMVLAVTDVATVERAIAATGEINRADAILAICRAYIEGKQGAARQHDVRTKGGAADQLAQAVARELGGTGNARRPRRGL